MEDDKYVVVEMANGDTMIGIHSFFIEKIPIVLRNLKRHEFVPIVIYREYGKVYKCPFCGRETGTQAPLHPAITSLFPHYRFPQCINLNKIPVEK